VNFWPTKDLDNYINLQERVKARMALVDLTATGEENILQEELELINEDLKFRNKQLEKLKNEQLDWESTEEEVSLSDFSLDDFRMDLMDYFKRHEKELRDAPAGLYAVVPALSGPHTHPIETNLFNANYADIIKPGVVFCLQQTDKSDESEKVNPLQPYFLIYIRNDGTVRFNFVHAKQTLDIYRHLCLGRKNAYTSLCELFNDETAQGKNMSKYTGLMKQAVTAIQQKFGQRNALQLTASRSALLIPKEKRVNDETNCELVTWLVIK